MGSFKRWQICAPCCSGCTINFQAKTCPDAYTSWGNLLPPGLVSPSSISVYLAQCNGFNPIGFSMCDCTGVGPAVSEIFYPLANPSLSGQHTFNFNKNAADTLVVNYDNSYFPSGFQPFNSIFYLADNQCNLLCNSLERLNVKPVDGYVIQGPCAVPSPEDGHTTWYYDYNRPFQAAGLAQYDGIDPYYMSVNCGGSTQCQTSYCPCSQGGVNGFCFYSCMGQLHTGYYKVFANNTSLHFKVTSLSPQQLAGTFGYFSDAQLAYAYVLYYPSGIRNNCFITPPPQQDQAYAFIGYYGVLVNGTPRISCDIVDVDILDVTPIGLSPPAGGWSGPTAFADAEAFVSNLPTTIQYGQYGTDITDGIVETFYGSGATANCPNISYSNQYVLLSQCDNSVIFSGVNTLNFRIG